MKRQLFIIKGFAKSDQESNSMDEYIDKYYSYFSRKAGGAWDEHEIQYLDNPIARQLSDIANNANFDFTVSIFIGHGGLQNAKQLFQINKTDVIQAGQFLNKSPKQLLIFESCRTTIANIPTVDITDKPPKFKYGGRVLLPIKRSVAQSIYFQSIKNCSNGVVACFACDATQAASNFYYSYGFLSVAMEWHLNQKNVKSALSVIDLMTHLNQQVDTISRNQINQPQNPVFTGDIHFPIAITKY